MLQLPPQLQWQSFPHPVLHVSEHPEPQLPEHPLEHPEPQVLVHPLLQLLEQDEQDVDLDVPEQVDEQPPLHPPLQVDEQLVQDEDFDEPSHPPLQEYEQLVLQPPLQVLLQPLHPKASSSSSSSFSHDNKLGPIMTMPNIGKDFLIAFLKKALLLYKSSIVCYLE